MNRILQVTDEDDTLVLEFVDLDDLRNERILPNLPCSSVSGSQLRLIRV